MSSRKIIVVGGGAAGFFSAITAAERGASVVILEKSARVLDKVRISGGGRCNVTHACFDVPEFAARYPRGGRALRGPFTKFSARDTVEWFAARGVPLKTEADGRMFPGTNTSQTIVDCMLNAAERAGVTVRLNAAVQGIKKTTDGGFLVSLMNGEVLPAERVLLATGGCRAAAAGELAMALGHTLIPPVPSLFTFQIEVVWLRSLAGVTAEVEVCVPSGRLRQRGPLLVTHWGVSGPAVLKLSAWGARELHALDYRFPLLVNWLPESNEEKVQQEFQVRRETSGAKLVVNVPLAPLTARLWEQLVIAAGVPRTTRWAELPKQQMLALARQIIRSEFFVIGKSLNKDEFVTCGGVPLPEVQMQTMESRVCPGLFFAGELLDIDGVTGGFNFQAAWTTGFLAGNAIAD